MFVGLDLQYRPMRPTRTCRFLTVGEVSDRRGTFYGRCALGDAGARTRWINRVDPERLHKLNQLRTDLAAFLRPNIEELWRLKGDQLRARRLGEGDDPVARTEALRAFSGRVSERIEMFLNDHSDTLEQLQLPREPLIKFVRVALDAFVEQSTAEQGEVELPQELLAGLPPEILTLLRPDSTA